MKVAAAHVHAGVGIFTAAGERVGDLRGGQLSLGRTLVALLLEAVVLLVADQLVVPLEHQVALLAGVVDVDALLVVRLERRIRLVLVDLTLLLTGVLKTKKKRS